MMCIHLNMEDLHTDVERVRGERSRLDQNAEIEIQLIWKKDNDEHMVRVFAQGPNLWVNGYYSQRGEKITFNRLGKKSILNYADSDVGCLLTLPAIAQTLEELRKEQPPTDFRPGGNSPARKAYVMCVFMASEIVRNELLEKVLLKQTNEGNPDKAWNDYLLIYKTWSKASEAMHGVENNTFYQSIREGDFRDQDKIARLRRGLIQNEYEAYGALWEKLQSTE